MADVSGSELMAEVAAVRAGLNHLLDVTDAFNREACASLTAASEGRFYREFLLRGMPGSFRDGAIRINKARAAMESAAREVGQSRTRQLALADEFEAEVLRVSENVAAAATELSATAHSVAQVVSEASAEVARAHGAIASLNRSSEEIQEVTLVIGNIAAQTKLLSLNATIEAARAGEVGRSFAVVASEVKGLADQTNQATVRVIADVSAARNASDEAIAVIERVGATVTEMNAMVQGIAQAVDTGSNTEGSGGGLAQLAEHLQSQLCRFLEVLRA